MTLANGREVWGEAECSYLDNYSRKRGREIALGRAIKAVSSPGRSER